MEQIVMLAGILVLLYGVAVLAGGGMAATRPLRSHSRTYGLVATAGGGVLLIVGITLLVAR